MNINNKVYLAAFVISITLLTLLNLSSCDGPTDPEIEPGRRDYTWTRDTLKLDEFDMLSMTGIWGSSPNDIWVGGTAQSYKHVLWHYNGIKWSKHILDKSISIGSFYGIDKNNIWASTTSSSIWHYNGYKWSEHTTLSYDGYDVVALNAIDGFSNNEIYAVGTANSFSDERTRVIIRFNGIDWKFVNISQGNEILPDVKVDESTKKVFIVGDKISNRQIPSYIYILEGDSLIEILSSRQGVSMGKIKGKVYHAADKKIQKYEKNELKLVADFTNTNFAGRIWGRSEKDFFCLTWDFTIAHYNGTDLKDIYPLNYNFFVADALIFEKDVFFICDEFGTGVNFILHGKLE